MIDDDLFWSADFQPKEEYYIHLKYSEIEPHHLM